MKKDGIYFGLPETEYFAEPRIGSTLLRTLIDSPTKFWFESYLNPVRKEKTKACLNAGKIFHKIILEGEDKLNADFAIAPKNLHPASSAYKIWRDSQIRPIIKEDEVKEALRVTRYLTGKGQVLHNFFTDGYPEVSILWTDDNGLKRAARIDYLKIGQLIDLKSFENWQNTPNFCVDYFWRYKVFAQLQDYMKALQAARTLPVLKGTVAQKRFWAKCTEVQEWLSWVCFVSRETPQYRIKTFTPTKCPEIYKIGQQMIAQAYKNFDEYMGKFGPAHAWIDEPAPDDLEFTDADFAKYIIGHELQSGNL